MKVMEQRSDMLVLPCRKDQSSSGVHNWLQSVDLIAGQTLQRGVAVVQSWQHQRNDQWLQNCWWHQSSNASQLAQNGEAAWHSLGDFSLHGDIRVDVDSEVTNWWWRWHVISANSQGDLWKLVLPSIGRAPENLGFRGVQLKAVWLHPHSNIADARKHLLLELSDCCGTAEAVDLHVISVHVDADYDAQSAAVGSPCTAVKVSVQGPIPACGTPHKTAVMSERDMPRRT